MTLATPAALRTTSTGRRTFAINPGNEPPLSDSVLGFALDQAQAAAEDGPGRVAWLCASTYEADELSQLLTGAGRTVHRLRAGDDPAFERWKATPGADLVTAGRFDGLDMPDDVCRLVILPSVPAGFTEFERFAVAYLSDASYMRHRIGQRVTQALGRANRTENDSALYLGLDPAFAATLADTAVSSSIDTDLSAVIRRALEAHGNGWAPVNSLTAEFWSAHRTSLAPQPPASPGGRVRPGRGRTAMPDQVASDSADAEVTAVTRLWLGDHAGAASAAGQAAEMLEAAGETEHSAFWRYVQAHAYYERIGGPDIAAARRCVEQAVAAAPNTAWFVRLRRTAEALAGRVTSPAGHDALFLAWDDWIRESGPVLAAAIAQHRSWLRGTHDQRADALLILARLCGATASRPAGQSATDARWSWADLRKGHIRVWEVKTGTPDAVPRSYINQILGQITEERQRHPRAIVSGCLLVEIAQVEQDAQRAARDDVAIMHTDAALAAYDQMAGLLGQYVAAWAAGPQPNAEPHARRSNRNSPKSAGLSGCWHPPGVPSSAHPKHCPCSGLRADGLPHRQTPNGSVQDTPREPVQCVGRRARGRKCRPERQAATPCAGSCSSSIHMLRCQYRLAYGHGRRRIFAWTASTVVHRQTIHGVSASRTTMSIRGGMAPTTHPRDGMSPLTSLMTAAIRRPTSVISRS